MLDVKVTTKVFNEFELYAREILKASHPSAPMLTPLISFQRILRVLITLDIKIPPVLRVEFCKQVSEKIVLSVKVKEVSNGLDFPSKLKMAVFKEDTLTTVEIVFSLIIQSMEDENTYQYNNSILP